MTDQFVRKADPAEAFAALANDARVEIIRSLREADADEVAFSDLREAVGMVDPGQFNYHLGELTGLFVARTDDGYRLTQAGKRITGAIASGAYTVAGTVDPIELDDPCRACGGTQTLHYEDEVVRVECASCNGTSAFSVPPAAFAGHDREAIPRVASRYLRATIRRQDDGFCTFCDGRTRSSVALTSELAPTEVPPEDVEEYVDRFGDLPWARYDCRRCGARATVELAIVLLDHPAVAGFYYDHGIDVRERLVWGFPAAESARAAVRGRDPLRAGVSYRADGDSLTVVVDEALDVVDVEP